ncbi:MAG: anthranilate synthase component I family protein [Flavobacteriales bacterium]|nr:anthranilate synthase component I family protein [Flavobacteriales bacterium]MBP9080338.1 anthranilate synthase component I family protein [Flavobacteriales bacterium]
MELPWTGTINWQALQPFEHLLAKRSADRGEWVIGVGQATAPTGPWAVNEEPWGGERACFGYAGYDLKNRFEDLHSRHPPRDGFAESAWWCPAFIFRLGAGSAELIAGEDRPRGHALLRALIAAPGPVPAMAFARWTRTTGKQRYMAAVATLLRHIHRGDIYEVNYCTQRVAVLPRFEPLSAFARLLAFSDAPHAAYLRHGNHHALCASPERFLRLHGEQVVTQPMKGTRPRGRNEAEDLALALELVRDPKERSENIMALDVARNDLSRIATPGSVHVDELCTVKSYPNVHQLVSTASARLRPGTTPMDLLRATFPMASMTGAPKVRAMQLIDEVEDMRRGLFSGTIGHFLPDGTADLNVVIRTITWDAATGRAALISGGAITAASTPEQEWAECEHKAHTVLNAFGHAC